MSRTSRKSFQLITELRSYPTFKESPSRKTPKKDFPSPTKWRGSSWSYKNSVFQGLVSDLGVEDVNPDSDWIILLPAVMEKATSAKQVLLVQWLEKLEKDAEVRCPRAQFVGKQQGGVLKAQYVDCQTRSCKHCHSRWVVNSSERWAKAFQGLGEYVYLVVCDDFTKASSVMDYSTRLEHSTLRLPAGETQFLLITTQPRKGAQMQRTADLEDFISEFLVPLGKDDGRVTTNRYLREAVALAGEEEGQEEEPEKGQTPADEEVSAGVVISPSARHWAVARGYITYDGRHTWTITIPEDQVARFWQINSGQPPEHQYRSAA